MTQRYAAQRTDGRPPPQTVVGPSEINATEKHHHQEQEVTIKASALKEADAFILEGSIKYALF